MDNKYKNLLSDAVDAFYKAKKSSNDKEKLYYKGLTEGMIMIIREGDFLSRATINEIVDAVQLQHAEKVEPQKGPNLADINTPTFIRGGKDIDRYLV